LILQEAPKILGLDSKFGLLKTPPQNLLTFSAKSTEALEILIESYKTFLTAGKETLNLDSVAYTANTGRAQFPHRVAVWGKNCQDSFG
jgi:acyl transferase domain-containing protein